MPVIEDLQNTIRTELPVTQHLGIRVVSLDRERVTLAAPLALNRNHVGSAFAGSLNAVATLAGWSWMWALLRFHGLPARVVIQDSRITYERPVTSDFQATCGSPDSVAVARLLAALQRRGRGRLSLDVLVTDQTGPAASFRGRYVAQRLADPDGLTTDP
jgi:thioesterase domain-containing protein